MLVFVGENLNKTKEKTMNRITTKLNPEGFFLMEDGTVSVYHKSVYTQRDIWGMREETKHLKNQEENK
jgi:hypothetical protein